MRENYLTIHSISEGERAFEKIQKSGELYKKFKNES